MQKIDVVRVKETVTVKPWFEDEPIEIKAGWEKTIVSLTAPEDPLAGVEFTEYRDIPILADLEVTNLEVKSAAPLASSVRAFLLRQPLIFQLAYYRQANRAREALTNRRHTGIRCLHLIVIRVSSIVILH
jgi:hypothetical protein